MANAWMQDAETSDAIESLALSMAAQCNYLDDGFIYVVAARRGGRSPVRQRS